MYKVPLTQSSLDDWSSGFEDKTGQPTLFTGWPASHKAVLLACDWGTTSARSMKSLQASHRAPQSPPSFSCYLSTPFSNKAPYILGAAALGMQMISASWLPALWKKTADYYSALQRNYNNGVLVKVLLLILKKLSSNTSHAGLTTLIPHVPSTPLKVCTWLIPHLQAEQRAG